MLFYLYGPDSFRRTKKLNEIVNKYKDKYKEKADSIKVDLEDDIDQWKDVVDFISQPSMFVSSKVVVVYNPTLVDKKEWINSLKKEAENPNVFLVLSEDKKKPKKAFSFLLGKPVNSQVFEELKGNKLLSFIKKEMRSRSLEFEKEALSLFVSYVKTIKEKSAFIVNELEKIYLSGLSSPISVNDLSKLTNWVIREKMYITVNRFLRTKDEKKKMIILNHLLSRDEDAAHIFNLLGYQAKGHTAKKLANLDVAIKSGKMEYEDALLSFVL